MVPCTKAAVHIVRTAHFSTKLPNLLGFTKNPCPADAHSVFIQFMFATADCLEEFSILYTRGKRFAKFTNLVIPTELLPHAVFCLLAIITKLFPRYARYTLLFAKHFSRVSFHVYGMRFRDGAVMGGHVMSPCVSRVSRSQLTKDFQIFATYLQSLK